MLFPMTNSGRFSLPLMLAHKMTVILSFSFFPPTKTLPLVQWLVRVATKVEPRFIRIIKDVFTDK